MTGSQLPRHPLIGPVGAVVALVAVLALAQLTLPVKADTQVSQAGKAPVKRTTLVCPHPVGRVAVAPSPGGDGAGRAVVRELGGEGRSRLGVIQHRGVVWTATMGERAPATVVRARGAMAGGLGVEQISTAETGAGQGLSATRCPRPDTSFWFVGGGVELGRTTTLYLVNAGGTSVSVDVAVYGPAGPVTGPQGGITVQPHSRKSVRLGALAPKARITALHVGTRGGPVVAALHTRVSGQQGGTDWIPRAVPPRTELVVPGLPGGGGSRRLLLAAPGGRPATVQLQLVTSKGTSAPRGERAVRVPAGSVVGVNLTDSLSRRPAAVRVTSDVPVTAAAAVTSGGEVAYVSAVPALTGGAVVATNGRDADVASTLLLSAPLDTGEVRVTVFGPDGPVSGTEVVRIPAGRTVSARLSPPSSVEGSVAVVVTPTEDSGRVHGARVLRRTGGASAVTILPLRTSREWVRVPDAEQSLQVVIPSP